MCCQGNAARALSEIVWLRKRAITMDLTLHLKSLQFEGGLTEEERHCGFLRSRAAASAVCGSAHAVFLCRLVSLCRDKLNHLTNKSELQPVKVGIIGGGHMGKQLALLLLTTPGFKPANINISTKRPDSLREFSDRGVRCYFDNRRLAAWADVIFLCVLPSQLCQVCADLHSQLPARCLVYTFTSAVQLHRLKSLLGHMFVLRPQYSFKTCDSGDLWLRHNLIAAALKDEEVLRASCPLSVTGALCLDQRWLSAVLYTLLNLCTAEGLSANRTVQVLNEMFQTTTTLTCQSFVNSSWASKLNNSEEPFPWINLIDVQTKQSPLHSFLSGCKALQDCISVIYRKTFSG
ncbi:NADP-dependent oxidoreductase domain-containing protein 1 [Hemibagrus wyckioides]|uniref:NADP-dependent oxidoreductase domain-containing protein 1 n=1 Tax=Hemibagrus wyckioides TaxID=337641 RepID=UPI00266D3E2D|nr:NADP-dependent oxidoreductase domain-containing protein 1 [Hemibagrus wyckioides]